MVLQYTCPSCRAEVSLEVVIAAAIDDAEARRAIEYLIRTYQPTLAAAVLRYLRMHTPAKQRLSWGRVRKVLSELVEAMRSRKITRAGRDWQVTVDDWQAAFAAIFEAHEKGSLELPLKDNAYLYAVLVRRANRTEAAAEAQAEQAKRHGIRETHERGKAVSAADALAGLLDAVPAAAQPMPATPAPMPTDTPALKAMRAQIARAKERREAALNNPINKHLKEEGQP